MVSASGDGRPALVVASRDVGTRERLLRELTRRYTADYQVVGRTDGPAVAALLADLRDAGTDVALVIAALGANDPDGIELLESARPLHPTALRVIAVRWGDWSTTTDLISDAMTMGRVDQFLIGPEGPADEEFHRFVTEYLSEWRARHGGGFEAVRVVDAPGSARATDMRDLFFRNRIPAGFYEVGSPLGDQLLGDLGLADAELPVVTLQFGPVREVLIRPSNMEIADAFGLMTPVAADEVFDLAIVGAGPAGLAAAVYATSEGLRTLVLEREAIGGQAGSSSLIRNYLGFGQGVSGTRLASSAFQQAWTFGAQFRVMRTVRRLSGGDGLLKLDVSDGSVIRAYAVVLAGGVSYRRLDVPSLAELTGRGVFYGASASEAPAMRDRTVFVVGGGNSAGQAAVYFARWARQVTIVVRGASLATSMSRYLVREIESLPNIEVRYQVRVVGGAGESALESIDLADARSGRVTTVPADAVFILIGTQPHTDWLGDAITRDEWGFIRTGPDLGSDSGWPESRPPMALETSRPGVFAAGDIRRGSVKRVAAAVGEGAAAVQLIHEYLAETAATRGR